MSFDSQLQNDPQLRTTPKEQASICLFRLSENKPSDYLVGLSWRQKVVRSIGPYQLLNYVIRADQFHQKSVAFLTFAHTSTELEPLVL
mmetsp:Transcript_20637/g.25404  ORF Transcript_20637/g.25404 Transcript_20637/m.25404 type:complete len:88 (-) Transcript_20637:521-784(-)